MNEEINLSSDRNKKKFEQSGAIKYIIDQSFLHKNNAYYYLTSDFSDWAMENNIKYRIDYRFSKISINSGIYLHDYNTFLLTDTNSLLQIFLTWG